jgi:hypothetical protein
MNATFLDTSYLVALLSHGDNHHEHAVELEALLQGTHLVTSELVLGELLNYFCDRGRDLREQGQLRAQAVAAVRELRASPQITVEAQTPELFEAGLNFYADRSDKGYSLVDCTSMIIMRSREIIKVATTDRHFVQEGFVRLI